METIAKQNDFIGIGPSVGVTVGAIILVTAACFLAAFVVGLFPETDMSQLVWCTQVCAATACAIYVARQWLMTMFQNLPRWVFSALLALAYLAAFAVVLVVVGVGLGCQVVTSLSAGDYPSAFVCLALVVLVGGLCLMIIVKTSSRSTFLCLSLLIGVSCLMVPLVLASIFLLAVVALIALLPFIKLIFSIGIRAV